MQITKDAAGNVTMTPQAAGATVNTLRGQAAPPTSVAPAGFAAVAGQSAPVAPAAPSPFLRPGQAAIDRLKANPHEAPMYDKMFGPGAAAKVLGQ